MANVSPFSALRPTPEAAATVAAPAADHIDRAEAKTTAGNNPLSFLRVTCADIELADDVDPYADAVHLQARHNLRKLKAEVPLVVEESPAYYLYATTSTNHCHHGIVVAASIDDYDNGLIHSDAEPRRRAEDDRTQHLMVTEAHTSPALLTTPAIPGFDDLVQTVGATTPLYDLTADDTSRHRVWRIPPRYTDGITNALAEINHLTVAAGHHHARAASRARDWCLEHNARHTGDEAYNRFLAIVYPGIPDAPRQPLDGLLVHPFDAPAGA